MRILDEIINAIGRVLELCFFEDSTFMSKELINILSHPDDRKIYVDAIRKLHEPECKSITFELSSGPMTLYKNY